MSPLHPVRAHLLISFVLTGLAACGADSPRGPMPDAAGPPSTIPASPAGTFTLSSTLDIHVPAAARPALTALTAATDGPDDPTRYLLDRMVTTLPDGSAKQIAAAAVPYVAAYVNARLADIAPRFVPGLSSLAAGMTRIATHLGTVETLRIDAGGNGTRTITGLRFELDGAPVVVALAEAGMADLGAPVRVTMDAAGHLAIAEHQHALPYGALVRLGIDRAVVPSVQPGAHDLAEALGGLLDCTQLGRVIADRVGLGPAALYAGACQATMTAIASEVVAALAAIDGTPLGIAVAGTATGFDREGDGAMDELRAGLWTGAVAAGSAREPIAAARFAGAAAR